MAEAGMVIVGAGETGARAAMVLREEGWGGAITLVGDEAEPPYERPPLSKSAITCIEEPGPKTICDAARMAEAGIGFLGGIAATRIDPAAHAVDLAGGRRIRYSRLLIATGARARPLRVAGDGSVLYLRSFADAQALRRCLGPGVRVGIVGGGFIGLELAASAAQRGATVTVVELAPRIMGRAVPEAIAAIVAARHASAGVRLLCGVGVERIEAGEGVTRIVLATGETIDCDAVIAGVGAVPDTALAAASGLAIENGVRADATLRTSDPDIFAAGDCCSFPHPLFGGRRIRLEAWRNAQDQGRHVARAMLGADEAYETPPWFWSDQYELSLQIAGLPDAGETEVVRRRPDGLELRFRLDGEGRLVSAGGIGPDTSIAKDIRLAELLIARRATPDPARLSDPAVGLKSLLQG